MGYSAYVGHPSQLCSVEEDRLQGGKGDGMRLLQIRNAAGVELTISADRCADISRLIFKGDNMGYFSPCGGLPDHLRADRGRLALRGCRRSAAAARYDWQYAL